MTDKQLEEKKKQFVLDTVSLLERELTENDLDIIFGWIEKLVEEVEDSLVQEFEDCISEELLIDVEKFLDLKDTVESKWD